MKSIKIAATIAALIFSVSAQADVILIKKAHLNDSTEQVNRNRYDDEIARLRKQTDNLADQMLHPEKYTKKTNKNDSMKITLISKR